MSRTVLITGASSGYGAATARRFAAAGDRLILIARREERLRALADEVGVPCCIVVLDIRDRDAIFGAVAALPPPFDAIDVLVNNAGLALGLEPAHEVDLDLWTTMIDTNVTGLVMMTRAVLPGMVARQRGHVVNIGSVAGTYPYPGGNVYGATKAFVKQLSRNLKADLLGTPIRVTNIEPGASETEFSVVRFGGDTGRAADVYEGYTPLSGDDIADAVFWAASRPAHVNIQSIEIFPTAQTFGPFVAHRQRQSS